MYQKTEAFEILVIPQEMTMVAVREPRKLNLVAANSNHVFLLETEGFPDGQSGIVHVRDDGVQSVLAEGPAEMMQKAFDKMAQDAIAQSTAVPSIGLVSSFPFMGLALITGVIIGYLFNDYTNPRINPLEGLTKAAISAAIPRATDPDLVMPAGPGGITIIPRTADQIMPLGPGDGPASPAAPLFLPRQPELSLPPTQLHHNN